MMLFRTAPAVAAAAILLLAACGEAVAPPGPPVDVTVRAYVDRDNSGAFSSGDEALANAKLDLADVATDVTVATATTSANGAAVFVGVRPGSYRVTAPSAPTGAVLASSAAPRVTVSYIGAVTAEDVRFAYLPATISGRVFRDDNANGTYDATDTPGPGLGVALRRAGSRVDSVTTDATGAFTFRFLAPGTYDVALESPTTISFGTAGATRAVVVAAGATVPLSGVFTGSLITEIATVRTRAAGSLVAVLGRLTARPGSFPSGTGGVNSEIWLQDATGGIAAFSVPTADSATFALGDTIEVSGTTAIFSGQRQLQAPGFRLVRRNAGAPIAPLAQTVAQAKALTNEGRLVTIPNLRVASVPTGTGTAFTVLAFTGTDTLQIRVAGALTGLSRATFAVGDRYTFTGILSQFNGTAQLKPRTSADVQPAITPIAALRTRPTGTVASVTGTLIAAPGMFTSGTNGVNSELWVQDATGGIAVFSVPTADSTTLRLGDRLEVTGTLGVFSGQLQLGTPTYERLASGTALTPVALTGTELNARTREGQLVALAGVVVTAIPTGTAAAFTVTGTTPDGQTVQVRIHGLSTGLSRANFTLGATYTLTGILTQFNGTAQLKLRRASDVTP